jgi:osmoprotectant transport system permease protein
LGDQVLRLTLEHLALVLGSVGLAALAGIPLGIWLSQVPAWRRGIMGLISVGQTIPSLALLGFLIPLAGVGRLPAVIALVIYALLPITRNTVAGILAILPQHREVAEALGLTLAQRLREIELPLALPTILAGLRIAAVATAGTATIAAAIGGGGLGELIFRGVATVNSREILAGAIPAALIALTLDGGFAWIEERHSRRWRAR